MRHWQLTSTIHCLYIQLIAMHLARVPQSGRTECRVRVAAPEASEMATRRTATSGLSYEASVVEQEIALRPSVMRWQIGAVKPPSATPWRLVRGGQPSK